MNQDSFWLRVGYINFGFRIRLSVLGFGYMDFGSWILDIWVRLSVLGLWIYGFRLSVIGLWIYGFRLSVLGFWIGIGCDILGLWIDRVSTSNFWFLFRTSIEWVSLSDFCQIE
ncbi:unnamed protein product [Rhizophagus irregularis]|nr:unnamed protein product [Rhizophagus irregularis]